MTNSHRAGHILLDLLVAFGEDDESPDRIQTAVNDLTLGKATKNDDGSLTLDLTDIVADVAGLLLLTIDALAMERDSDRLSVIAALRGTLEE